MQNKKQELNNCRVVLFIAKALCNNLTIKLLYLNINEINKFNCVSIALFLMNQSQIIAIDKRE